MTEGSIVALEGKTGKELWSVPFPDEWHENISTPLWTGAQLIELLFEIRVLICFGFDQEQASKIVKSNARWYGRVESLKSKLHSLRLLARAKI